MITDPKIETNPQRQPGCCHSCGAGSQSDRKWFIDTDTEETDTPGFAIIFCNYCFGILADRAGYVILGEAMESNRNRIKELEAEIERLSTIASTFDMLGLDPKHIERLNRLAALDDGVGEPESDKRDSVVSRRKKNLDKGTERLDESGSEQGLDDVRSTEQSVSINI